jgi:hypothetical protein
LSISEHPLKNSLIFVHYTDCCYIFIQKNDIPKSIIEPQSPFLDICVSQEKDSARLLESFFNGLFVRKFILARLNPKWGLSLLV